MSIDLQAEIRDLAAKHGLEADEVAAMAEAIISEHVAEKRALDQRGQE